MVYHLPRDHVRHDVSGCIQVTRHGTAHQGPVGEEVISHQFQVSYIVILSCHGYKNRETWHIAIVAMKNV